jgi:methionyl-tRNA formyltransferase
MKILFLGYGKVGWHCLNALIKNNILVIGVVPRASDLANVEDDYSIRKLAQELSLPVYKHSDVKQISHSFDRNEVDYLISVQYDRILKDDWLKIPSKETLNLHLSLLPRQRGCYPTKWAIIEEQETGTTLHSVDQGIDTGDILDQKKASIETFDTDKSLYEKLSLEAVELFKRNIINIKKGIFPNRSKQNESRASYHPKNLPFNGHWNSSWNLELSDRFFRAFYFPPYPPALFKINGQIIGLPPPYRVSTSRTYNPGYFRFLEDGIIEITCADGILLFNEIWYNGNYISSKEFKQY